MSIEIIFRNEVITVDDTFSIDFSGGMYPQGLQGERGPAGPAGPEGPRGPKGDPGHTPEKGVDYWTSSDIESMESDILESQTITDIQEDITQLSGDLTELETSIAPVESTSTATAAHAVGELFLLGETLLVALSAIAVGDTITTEGNSPNAAVTKLTDKLIKDVQVNGTSVLNQGVANLPLMGYNTIGVARAESTYGITTSGTTLMLNKAADNLVKQGTYTYQAIVPSSQHLATFYGLCKAAGVDMASSSNAVGVYTDAAKVAIQKMLGIYEAPWELIREDTFTNANIADHIISVDGNGNDFWLTDMALMFETPTQETASEKGTSGLIKITIDSSEILAEVGAWTQAANAAPRGAFVFVEQRKGFVTTHYSAAVGYATSKASDNYRYLGFESASSRKQNGVFLASSECYITSINIKSVLGTGHYILYGKRKWS